MNARRIAHNKKSTEIFKKEVFELSGNEYEVLGEYERADINIEMRHNICGFIFKMRPVSFTRQGQRCPECGKKQKQMKLRKSHSAFEKELYEKWNDEFSVLSKYINATTKIQVKHNKCDHIFEVAPYSLLTMGGCPKCKSRKISEKLSKSHEVFLKEVNELFRNEYSILSDYENCKKKVKVRHNICGCEYEVTPSNLLRGRKCPNCFGTPKKTTEQFKQEVFEKVGYEYTVLGTYKGTNSHIKIKHNTCNHIYMVQPANFLYGFRCPKCNESKGEKRISDYLTKNNIQYIYQYRIKNCRNNRVLPFDFALLKDNELKVLIEYDGEQHYKPFYKLKGSDKAEIQILKTQINDKLKDSYCEDNNITLIRIPYWDYEIIENILEKVILSIC